MHACMINKEAHHNFISFNFSGVIRIEMQDFWLVVIRKDIDSLFS